MNKILKVTLIIFLSLGALLVVGVFVILLNLPSVSSIGKALLPGKKSVPVATNSANSAGPASQTNEQFISSDVTINQESKETSSEGQSQETKAAMFQDMADSTKPVSDFCAHLKSTQLAPFTDDSEVNKAMEQSVLTDNKDPRMQALKPTMRYVMQLPQMNELLKEVQAAGQNEEESLMAKAGFYAKVLSAFKEIESHQSDIESVIDRTYFYHNLNKLVTKRPDLLESPSLQNYCQQVEQDFNQKRSVDFEKEKRDFQTLLESLQISPAEIGYDQKYKSKVNIELGVRNIGIKGDTWLSEVFGNSGDQTQATK